MASDSTYEIGSVATQARAERRGRDRRDRLHRAERQAAESPRVVASHRPYDLELVADNLRIDESRVFTTGFS